MGQGQATPEYMDIFDSESRRLSRKHKEDWERAHSVDSEGVTVRRDEFRRRGHTDAHSVDSEGVAMRRDEVRRRGHTDEESTDYCYAYTGSVSHGGLDGVDGPEHTQVGKIGLV